MSDGTFNPNSTLAVILGASEWPQYDGFQSSEAFCNSAKGFTDYLLGSDGLCLPEENLKDLFNSEDEAIGVLEAIDRFLRDRIQALKERGINASDLILYYVGHGGFATASTSDFFLAMRSTRLVSPEASSLQTKHLASVLDRTARHLRRYLFLDCCFAAAAYQAFQSGGPLGVAAIKIMDAFPPFGTALFCASGPKDPAKAPPHLDRTMFTGALLKVLSEGDEALPSLLSLRDLGHLVDVRIRHDFPTSGVRPEVHAPKQTKGRVDEIPIFPNVARPEQLLDYAQRQAQEEAQRQAQEEAQRQAQEERRRKAAAAIAQRLKDDEERRRVETAAHQQKELLARKAEAEARRAEEEVQRQARHELEVKQRRHVEHQERREKQTSPKAENNAKARTTQEQNVLRSESRKAQPIWEDSPYLLNLLEKARKSSEASGKLRTENTIGAQSFPLVGHSVGPIPSASKWLLLLCAFTPGLVATAAVHYGAGWFVNWLPTVIDAPSWLLYVPTFISTWPSWVLWMTTGAYFLVLFGSGAFIAADIVICEVFESVGASIAGGLVGLSLGLVWAYFYCGTLDSSVLAWGVTGSVALVQCGVIACIVAE